MMVPEFDRRVHAEATDGTQVVRYERAGKWWIEPPVGSKTRRQQVDVEAAAHFAVRAGDGCGTIILGLPGGKRFDHLVLKYDGQ